MKKLLVSAVVLGAVLHQNQGAFAKTLEDVLREKGVITEEDYKEVTKNTPIDYKLGKGFTFTSRDEKFQLTFGGRMQFRYTYTNKDDKYTAKTDRADTNQFDAKRIRLTAQGYAYSKDLTYKLEFDPRGYASDTKKGLYDAYMNYRLIDEAQLRVGQFKTPFSRQELTSDGALQFVDRSIVVDAFKPTYDIGAMLHGKVLKGIVYYYGGVFGGAGQTSTRTSTNNALFVARLAVNPLGDMEYSEPDLNREAKPLLSFGANYFRNTLNKTAAATATSTGFDNTITSFAASGGWFYTDTVNNNTFAVNGDKVDIDSYGADMAFKWMGVSLQGEYLLAQAQNHRTDGLRRAQGFYAQAGYTIIPKTLEAAFRYSYLDPNRDNSNDHKIETIGSVSYYFNKHNLKLQGDVGNIHSQATVANGGPKDDLVFRLQAQLIF